MICGYGVWSTPTGACSPNYCPRPADTTSTIYSQASCPSPTLSGSSCLPSCQLGYNATGSLSLSCMLGTFTAVNPSAVCSPLPFVRPPDTPSTSYSSSCSSSTPSSSSCTPVCKNGYSPSASLTINCLAGSFSSPVGFCTPNPCAPPTTDICPKKKRKRRKEGYISTTKNITNMNFAFVVVALAISLAGMVGQFSAHIVLHSVL